LDDSGLGYIKINSFLGDYRLLASLWEYYIQGLLDNDVPGLIIDLRENGGGYGGLAFDFAGYFFDQEMEIYYSLYYNNLNRRVYKGCETVQGKTCAIII